MLLTLSYVAIGGALGAISRTGISVLLNTQRTGFPWGTLTVNMLGSFLIGLTWSYLDSSGINPLIKWGLMTGFLGAFTTFSTFSLETIQLWQQGRISYAVIYVILSQSLGLGFTYLGLQISKNVLFNN